jgi:hypothetical protein
MSGTTPIFIWALSARAIKHPARVAGNGVCTKCAAAQLHFHIHVLDSWYAFHNNRERWRGGVILSINALVREGPGNALWISDIPFALGFSRF